MPNIVELRAPSLDLQATDRAADTAREAGQVQNRFARESGTALGGAVSRVGGQIGEEIDRHIASGLIGHGAANYSSLYGDLTQKWNELASKTDPNDTSIKKGFEEKVLQPALDSFQKPFDESGSRQAQDWAMRRTEELRQHFFEKTSADMATRAGAAVDKNMGDMEMNYSNVLVNDPTALPHVANSIKKDVQAIIEANPYITAGQAAKIKDELVPKLLTNMGKSAGYGMAQADPDGTNLAIKRGDFNGYLTAEEQIRLGHFADEVKTQKRVNQEHEYVQAKRVEEETAKTAKNDYVTNLLNGKPVGDYINDPRLIKFPEVKENIKAFQHSLTMQAIDRSENTPHPQEWRKVINDLHEKARTDPNNVSDQPIFDALKAGRLNKGEFASALSIYNGIDKPVERNTHNQILTVERNVKASIAGSVLFQSDPVDFSVRMSQLETDTLAKVKAAKEKGEDVTPLLDPNSPRYLLSKAMVAPYMVSSKQAVSNAADGVRATAGKIGGPAATPEESIEARVKSAGWKFEPAKFDYRIGPDGKMQRKPRG